MSAQYLYCRNHHQSSDFDYIDFDRLCEMAQSPIDLSRYATSREAKDQCPAFLPAAAPAKTSAAAKAHNRYGALVVDIDDWNLEQSKVIAYLVRLGVESYLLYTTLKSGITEPNREGVAVQYGWRWRVVIPLAAEVDGESWVLAQGFLAAQLGGDSCATRAQQISYAPARFKGDYRHAIGTGAPLDLANEQHTFNAAQATWRSTEGAKLLAVALNAPAAPRVIKTLPAGQVSPIVLLNEQHSVEELLERYGYTHKRGKWLHPRSTSGAAGVVILEGRYFSHHSRETDPLADGHTHDGFDLFTEWEHGGDHAAALKAAGELLLTAEGVSVTERNQQIHRAEWQRSRQVAAADEVWEPVAGRAELAQRIAATDDFDTLIHEIAPLIATSGLKGSEQLTLRKAIAAKAGVSVASLKADAQELMKANPLDNHLAAAKEIVTALGGVDNLVCSADSFWRWNERVWVELHDREVKQRIHAMAAGSPITGTVVASILDMAKTESYRKGHLFDNGNPDDLSISCENCDLVLVDDFCDVWGWEAAPHKRERYRTVLLPVQYDPEAQAPRFERFLREVFEGDFDSQQKRTLILEAVGYTLTTSTRFEKFFMLIGSGSNGKSVLLEVLARLVGQRGVCAVQPSEFENRFQLGHLRGKLANIVTEIAEGGEIADAKLKALVSGEIQTAEQKGKDPFDFRPVATHWFGTNHLPHTRDFSDALFRRAEIITFNNKFVGEKCNPRLFSELEGELSGILNLALKAVQTAFNVGHFTKVPSSEEIKQRWRTESDQAAQFLEECCTLTPEGRESSKAVYERYGYWANENGIVRRLGHKAFTNRLERLGVKPVKGTGGIRFLAGISLLKLDPNSNEWA